MVQTTEILELIYATKALAKAVEGLSTDLETLSNEHERHTKEIQGLKDLIQGTTKMLEVQEEIIRYIPLQVAERVQQSQDKATEHVTKLLGAAERDRDHAVDELNRSLADLREKVGSLKTQLLVGKTMSSEKEEDVASLTLKPGGKLQVLFGIKVEKLAIVGKWLWRGLIFLGAGGGAAAGMKALNEWLNR